jgi:cell division protein FtsI (penicillin-binding protein 3)
VPDVTAVAAMSSLTNSKRTFALNRQRAVVAAVVCAWLILAGRLVHVQLGQRARFQERAQLQQTWVAPIPARPGDLVDRDGRLLATTTCCQSLYINPSLIDDPERVAHLLEQALAINSADLLDRITHDPSRQFVWVKRRLSESEAQSVGELNLPPGVWGLRQEFRRQYPQGTLAAHVIGMRDIDGIGRGGAEQAFDSLLRGRDGQRRLVRDARGYVIEILQEVTQAPQQGETVVLTIDSIVQLIAERELDAVMRDWRPRSACAIVLDPGTGEVLAMASRPTFDPNVPAEVDSSAWPNRALSAAFEPGSTIKPCLVAWAVDARVIDSREQFDCEQGAYRMAGRVLHDHHPYGVLSVSDILVKSSNIGMAQIGERLSNPRLYEAAADFGFGRKIGIELPGELPGTLRPLEEWTSYSTGSIPMGQELACTPLQVIAAHAVLANGGKRVTPHVLLRAGENGNLADHSVGTRILSEETARWIVREPLTQVIERGTGTGARIDGLQVFGKSGTAQKVNPETGLYSSDRYVCSFVCGAPAQAPAVLVLVSVDEPSAPGNHYGGTVAAPAAAEILRRALAHLSVRREMEIISAAGPEDAVTK